VSQNLLSDSNLANARGLREIARGRGQTLAQMAIAWTLRDARVASALIGVSSVAQLDYNLAALEHLAFEPAELAEIDRFAVEGGVNLMGGLQHRIDLCAAMPRTGKGQGVTGTARSQEHS
jgi:L-glyceraldehyde 3-phosphate reductase